MEWILTRKMKREKILYFDVSKYYNSLHKPKFGTMEIIGVPDSEYKIETLINLGANINIQDNDGNGILHYILSRDNIGTEEYDIIEMLIKNSVNINLQNNDRDTALHKILYKKNNEYRDIDMEKKVISLLIKNICIFKNFFHLRCINKSSKYCRRNRYCFPYTF